MARTKAPRKSFDADPKPQDWLDREMRALPDLDEGLDFDLPGIGFDNLDGLDELLGIGDDLPDFPFDLPDYGERGGKASHETDTQTDTKTHGTSKKSRRKQAKQEVR